MGRTQESGGDYGYDLVHEDDRTAGGEPEPAPAESPAPAHSGEDASGDYAYDEAHDF